MRREFDSPYPHIPTKIGHVWPVFVVYMERIEKRSRAIGLSGEFGEEVLSERASLET